MLYRNGYELAVFTQPDRPAGRHAALTPPPTKVYALERGIPVYQFEKIRLQDGVSALKAYAPDLMVTAAFGQILSGENLSVPKYGCVNVHGSLLPKYRGAAPVQWAIIDGESQTGVTTMMTDIGMDTGDILFADSVDINADETAGELLARLAVLGAGTLHRTIAAIESGTLVCKPQDDAQATKCPILKKEHGKLEFSQSAQAVHNRVRGTNPWPGAYALLDGCAIKIHKTKPSDRQTGLEPVGSLTGNKKDGLFVRCADGWLEILELQSTGGKRLKASDYLLGKSLEGRVLV
jgi:methionyl-tRNA formyltransferase